EFLCRRQLENIQPPCDLRSVNLAVVPIRGPVAAEHKQIRIDGTTIEIRNLDGMSSIGEIHYRNAALVPSLHFDIATRHRNERSVVRYTVFAVALGSRQLVVAGKAQLVVLQVEDRISAPFVRIVRAAACAESAAPLICEYDF